MGKKASDQTFVVYELVGTGKTVVQRFDPQRPFGDFKAQVFASVGLESLRSTGPNEPVLKSVREGGKEVEIHDEYDFEGLKARAAAMVARDDGSSLLIRVHTFQAIASSSRSPFEATPVSASTKSKGKRKAIDASTSPVPLSTPAMESVKKSRKKKLVSSLDTASASPQIHSPTPPTPSPASSKRAREPSPPSPPSPSPNDSPATKKRKVIALTQLPVPGRTNLYKPLRPSPLGKQISEETPQEESARVKAEKRRRRKSKAMSSGSSTRSSSPQHPTVTPMEDFHAATLPSPIAARLATAPVPVASGSTSTAAAAASASSPTAAGIDSSEKPAKKVRRKTAKAAGVVGEAAAAPSRTAVSEAAPTPKAPVVQSLPSAAAAPPTPASATPAAPKSTSKAKKSSSAEEKIAKPPTEGQGRAMSIMAAHRERMRLEKEAKEKSLDVADATPAGSSIEKEVSKNTVVTPAAKTPAVPTATAPVQADAESSKVSTAIPNKEAKTRRKSQKHFMAGEAPTATSQTTPPAPAPAQPVDDPSPASTSSTPDAAASVSKPRQPVTKEAAANEAAVEKSGGCLLCGQDLAHLQKDCPVVLGGAESVAAALREKRIFALARPRELGLKKAVEALLSWQDRLARRERHPTSITPRADDNLPAEPVDAVQTPGETTAVEDEIPVASPSESVTPVVTPTKALAVDPFPQRPESQPPSPPTAIPPPIGLPYPARSALLSKQGTPSKSSRSGISQSDVVFQTADEDSASSESDDESASPDENSDDSASTASRGSFSSSRSNSADASDAGDDDAEIAAPPPEDSEELMRHFFGAPLSEKMKKKARLSGVSHDVARLPSKSPEDASGDEVEEPDRSRRRESLSSVDGPDEDDTNEGSSDERTVTGGRLASADRDSESCVVEPPSPAASSRSPSPSTDVGGDLPAIRSPEPETEPAPEQPIGDKRHSFAEMAASSPTMALDGDQAMVDAMAEDDAPDAWATVQTQADRFRGHPAVNILPSPPPSPTSSQNQLTEPVAFAPTNDEDSSMASLSPERSPKKFPEKLAPRWQISPQKTSAALNEDVAGAKARSTSKPNEASASTCRRSTRSASRDLGVGRATRSMSKEPISNTAPAPRSRRLRSASQEVSASMPPASPARPIRSSSRSHRLGGASLEVPSAQPSQTQPKASTRSKNVNVTSEVPSSQPLRRSSRQASTQDQVESSSQVDELATSDPPSAPLNGDSRFPSPVPEDDGEDEEEEMNVKDAPETQFTQYQSPPPRDAEDPLFLSLGSLPQQTQHYTTHPDMSSSFHDEEGLFPLTSGQPQKSLSPVQSAAAEDDEDGEEDDDEVYGSAAEQFVSPTVFKRSAPRGRSSLGLSEVSAGANGVQEEEVPANGMAQSSDEAESSDDESPVKTVVGVVQTPQRMFASQPSSKSNGMFASHIPTLSSLSSELLRMGRNAIGSSPRPSVSASQPNTPSILPAGEDDSSEDSDSSAEGAVPSALASRVAGATKKPRRSMRESLGW